MIILSAIIFIIYVLLILSFVIGLDRIPVFNRNLETAEKKNFSIIIPFRNEAENLPVLLSSLKQLNYNKNYFEILMVDDSSKDTSVLIIKQFQKDNPNIQVRVINNIRKSNSPKKDAISTAISMAKFEWIITTDADCQLPEFWLKTFDSFIQNKNPKMIVAPVIFDKANTFLESFQLLDFLSLQGSTIGGFGIKRPFLCNGANLCYAKNAFLEVKAFQGNESIASGDDIFILEKMIQKFPNHVKYVRSNECIVKTQPLKTISELQQQRIRWASKTSNYQNNFGKSVGIIVFMTNAFLIFLLFMALFQQISWKHFGIVFLVKFNVDFVLLMKTAAFFKQENILKKYFLMSLLHPFFIVYVALLSFAKRYEWKGRKFS